MILRFIGMGCEIPEEAKLQLVRGIESAMRQSGHIDVANELAKELELFAKTKNEAQQGVKLEPASPASIEATVDVLIRTWLEQRLKGASPNKLYEIEDVISDIADTWGHLLSFDPVHKLYDAAHVRGGLQKDDCVV